VLLEEVGVDSHPKEEVEVDSHLEEEVEADSHLEEEHWPYYGQGCFGRRLLH